MKHPRAFALAAAAALLAATGTAAADCAAVFKAGAKFYVDQKFLGSAGRSRSRS